MYQNISLVEFEKQCNSTHISVLLIKQDGCKFCDEVIDISVNQKLNEKFKNIHFFQISIEQESDIVSKLGLVGVPAFLKMNQQGHKKLKTGFNGLNDLLIFFEN